MNRYCIYRYYYHRISCDLILSYSHRFVSNPFVTARPPFSKGNPLYSTDPRKGSGAGNCHLRSPGSWRKEETKDHVQSCSIMFHDDSQIFIVSYPFVSFCSAFVGIFVLHCNRTLTIVSEANSPTLRLKSRLFSVWRFQSGDYWWTVPSPMS